MSDKTKVDDGGLKLFVWSGFCPDYTDGLAFAVAETEDEARKMIGKARGFDPFEWGDLTVHSLAEKVAFAVSGGS